MHLIIAFGTPLRAPSTVACLAVLLSLVYIAVAQGQTEKSPEPRLMMSDIYFHQDTDQPWELRIAGNVPSRAGMYLFMHDARGRVTLKRHVPYGQYALGKPLVIPIPADGYAGDYRLIIQGFQEDIRGLLLPLSTLSKEVYSGTTFAARNVPPLYFKAPPGVKTLRIGSYSGHLLVYEGDQAVLDTKTDGKLVGRSWTAPLKITPDAVYSFRKLGAFYFGSPDGLLLCFDINRWFVPEKEITQMHWWQLAQ